MSKVLLGLIASLALSSPAMAQHGHHHHHGGSNTGNVILGTIIGSYVIGQVLSQNRPAPQPQVIYVPVQQPPVQQTCEVRILQDQFGQLREFTTCYPVIR